MTSVGEFLDTLDHPLKPAIQALRSAILASDDGITESVKWNAPNFICDGTDRATFRLQPGNRFELILHRGAKVRDESAEFRFAEPSGLLEWLAPDRAVVRFRDAADAEAKRAAVVELVRRWVRA